MCIHSRPTKQTVDAAILSEVPAAASPAPMTSSPSEFIGTPFDPHCFGGDQGLCNDAPCIRQDPTVSVPGYRHHVCGRFLIQMLKIRQPQRFQFLYGQQDFTA
jgi:hypothetical protein